MSRRKDAARSPHYDHKVRNSGLIGHRARKGPACPNCNRRLRRKRTGSCHACGTLVSS